MCCRGCFVCAHEMFTLTKFDLCFCNFRKRQMALRKTWSLQQVFEVLLPFLSLWVKSPGVKIPHYSSIFPDLGPAFIAVSKASAGLGEQRFCCSLTAWAGAAAQRVLGRWPHTAPPWDAAAVAALVQPGLAVPQGLTEWGVCRLIPCRTPGCAFSPHHDPPGKVSDNTTRRDQRGIICISWSKQKSCCSQCKSRNTNPECQGTAAARLLMAASSDPHQDYSTQLLCNLYLLIHTGLDLSTAAQQQNCLWFMVQARGDSEIQPLAWVCSLKRKERQGGMICMVTAGYS